MPRILFLYILCFLVISEKSVGQAQTTVPPANELLSKVERIQAENKDKIDAAFTAMNAVRKAGAYIESLSDLFGNGVITLPVGIKKGDYELIIQKIKYDKNSRKSQIYATCAFQFKEDGERVAFEGVADIEGQKGLGTAGSLELMAPVRRNLGNKAAIIFNEGTKANFGCEGLESFNAKISLVIISDKIYAVDSKGKPTYQPITASFDAVFRNFDSYSVSFNLDKSFCFKGLQDVIFSLKGATLDQDDKETSAMVKFPQSYFAATDDETVKLWKGISISSASISLPAIFKKTSTANDTAKTTSDTTKLDLSSRVGLNLKNVIIDENGFTGFAEGQNIIASETIDKDKWNISLTDFSLNLLKNDVVGFGFGGAINIPPLGKSSLLPYKASFNSSTDSYEFVVNVSGEFDFPVLRSTLSLNQTSTVEILIKDSEFYPTLNASGKLTINAPINEKDSTKKFVVPDITFENLKISRSKPYISIGAIGVTGELKSPKVAGFELSISDIKSFDNPTQGSGLAFQAGIKLNEMFGGQVGLQLFGDYAHWKFKKVGVDRIKVDFKSNAYSLAGGVWFKNGDSLYGSGFRGDVKFQVLNKFTFDAVAVFGRVNSYRYFLTDVYFETSPTSGIIVPPALSFYGFGGGIYRRMQQSSKSSSNEDFGKALSGISYIPDKTVGMGFMATTRFGLIGSSSAFNAKVSFEMQFNDHGGLNFIQLRGDASFMNSPDKWGKLADNINDKVKKLESAGGKIKIAGKNDLAVPENKGSGFLTASMNIKYDIANSVFTADLSTYLNAGFIKGVGPNDRMGWASAYFSPDKWYTYVGTPSDRLGISILGLAKADGYFMVGDEIPELPPPPQKVLQNFSKKMQDKLNKRNTDNLTSGSGIAFGASLGVNFKAKLPPFYAKLGVGMGAEFLLKNYGENAYCAGGSSTLGINGWYARAQAWAWVEADIGMEARIFRRTRKFSILNMSASAMLAGSGPNPFYFEGAVGGRFSVMGGLISGKCNFDFEIGKECKVMGGSPFGEDIIAQLTPSSGEKDVNVFASPQAVFNIPIGVEMEIDEDDGAMAWYKVTLENFSVFYKDTKKKVEGATVLNKEGKICMLDPSEPLESSKEMVAYAKVGFKRKLNGKWIDVKGADGSPVFEEKSTEFTSGERPKTILPEHVKYSYPIANQYNFYPKEYSEGYLQVTENYAYLFSTEKPQGYIQLLRFSDLDGGKKEVGFDYITFSAGNDIRMEINFPLNEGNFNKNDIYKLAIVNVPQVSGLNISSNISTSKGSIGDSLFVTKQKAEGTLTLLEDKEVYSMHFRTSKYSTFKEKMATFDTKGTGWRDYIEPFVHHIKANITDDEFFDKNEIQDCNGALPVVQFVAQVEKTSWYNGSFYKNMYASFNGNEILSQRSAIDAKSIEYGSPPVSAIFIENMESDKMLTDEEIKSGIPSGIYPYGIFTYSLPFWCSRDFYLIRLKLANKVMRGSLTKEELAIMAADFPSVVTKGEYPVRVTYVLPGKNIVTTVVDIVMNNPI